MPKLIFFDFDGTLAESAQIKTGAFGKLFENTGKRDEIVRYHLANAGVSRYEKFDYIYKNILGEPLSAQKKKELGEEFSRIVFEEILKAPMVKGALEFLQKHCKSDRLYVVSSTPHAELLEILEKRNLKKYFREAVGAPVKKFQSIKDIIAKEGAGADDAVMVGDSTEDMKAAQIAGVRFVGRICEKESANFPAGTPTIDDLTELDEALDGVF